MLDYRRIQKLANRTTADVGANYDSHREQTMRRIREAADLEKAERKTMARTGTDSRILVAGAGNANDLNLPELAGLASELWLVDIDGDAISRALNAAAWGRNEEGSILADTKTWIGDAGGLVDGIDLFLTQTEKDPGDLAWALSELGKVSWLEGLPQGAPGGVPGQGSVDVAISQCLLSQIVWPVTERIWQVTGISWQEGQRRLAAEAKEFPYPLLGQVLRHLMLSHLSWLAWTVRPGGIVLVNSDVRWRGVPICGANPLVLRPEAGFFPRFEWGGVKTWKWSVEESVEALILSVMARKP
ncbi:Hypothetical protein DEACI_1734 [Acididesulfobacillus acetoxydans]|uniref:Uncharacterized protein n=1 Tax=Acididesulfobacillus acetoxydans TaxID=1561005 RepID=A0A8S0WXP6_9FIRM|nr:hypothetical protein [Acididesulfobacillus acetoxydans]CAA7601081.1 Hypothetical protein DEACI_1734 [Acididesulfobacillus acetoxydans]CEJ06955.1 Hypothetical protein DEACI_1409 [Acididesulfobacillus acetoxydans]